MSNLILPRRLREGRELIAPRRQKGFIINPYVFAAAPSTYLDSLAVANSCVLSLRKLATASSALCVRVRRSSDNAEQDIGFSGNAFDVSGFNSFIGSSDAFVKTIYEQNGNGLNAVQNTAANQPRIATAGSYLGSIRFDGTNDFMVVPSLPQGSQFAGIYTKLQMPNSFTFKVAFETGTTGASTAGSMSMYVNNSSFGWSLAMGNTGGGTSSSFPVTSIVALTQLTALMDRSTTGANETKFYRAGSNISPSGSSLQNQTGNLANLDLYIGARAGTSLYADMFLETAVFYNLDTAAIQTSIEAIVA